MLAEVIGAVVLLGAPGAERAPRQIEVGLSAGAVHYQVRENLLVPLRWQGFGPALGWWLGVERGPHRHQVDVRGPVAFVRNRYGHPAWSWELYVGYAYLHRVVERPRFGRLHVGPALDFSANGHEYYSWDASHIYWLNAYELGPTLRWEKWHDLEHRFSAQIGVPVVALASRPDPERFNDEEPDGYGVVHSHDNLRVTSFHEYVSVAAEAAYDYRVSKRVSIGVGWRLRLRRYSQPRPIAVLGNAVSFRVSFWPTPRSARG